MGLSRGAACATKIRRHMHRCPPTNGVPPSGPPVSLKPSLPSCLLPPYDKRKRHPSIETESTTPCAKIKPVPSIEHHNSPSGLSAEPRPPTDDSDTNAHTSFESCEILPTTPPKTPTIGTSPLSSNNSHPVDSGVYIPPGIPRDSIN